MNIRSKFIGLAKRVLPSPIKHKLKEVFFPGRISVHNTVPVRDVISPLDKKDHFPNYEEYLVEGIRTHTKPGDTVSLVGGGYGVSSVVTARQVGSNGHVHTYEASEKFYEKVQETIELNQVEDVITTTHSVIGNYHQESKNVYGQTGEAKTLAPSALTECDVLILDCEGAEKTILSDRELATPRVVIVETHEYLDSPEEKIISLLEDSGYKITSRKVESKSKGVSVLTAVEI